MLNLGKRTALAVAISGALGGYSQVAIAQDAAESDVEVITVTGMLSSLKSSMLDKKNLMLFQTVLLRKIWVNSQI